MRALTLWQPWASLVACGAKTIETRSWRTSYRGRLAIHAAKDVRPEEAAIVALPEFHDVLWPALGFDERPMPATVARWLPRGLIVATCILVDCVPIIDATDPTPDSGFVYADTDWLQVHDGPDDSAPRYSETEHLYGLYRPGRWAWLLDDIEALPEPVPARGRQQLWEWAA